MKAFQSLRTSWERRVAETPIAIPETRREKEDWKSCMTRVEDGLGSVESWEDILAMNKKQSGPMLSKYAHRRALTEVEASACEW